MTKPIVQLKNLTKTIKGKQIIKNVNLDILSWANYRFS